ncbi:MAG: iron-containing alcohol dehydrogenase, partial [Rhodobacterales bacterium]
MTDLSRPLRLHQPRRVEYGLGSAAEVGAWAKAEGFRRILVLTQRSMAGRVAALGLPGAVSLFAGVLPEPDTDNLALALRAAEAADPDLVVGFGGGSVMDLAKLVTVLRGGQMLAEVVGPNKVTGRQNALALVPTTAGTGSEAGIRALVTDVATGMKVAVETPFMLADMVALDPGLTMTLPPAVT